VLAEGKGDAYLVRPGSPALCNVILGVESVVMSREAGVLATLTLIDSILSKPPNPVQHRCGQVRDLGSIAPFRKEIFNSASETAGFGIYEGIGGDVTTVQIEGRVIYFRVPNEILPSTNSRSDHTGKIVIVGNIREAEDAFELRRSRSVVQANEDVVHHIGDFLRVRDALLICVDPDRLVVSPVIPDGFNDST
jgi:hypothetical protein